VASDVLSWSQLSRVQAQMYRGLEACKGGLTGPVSSAFTKKLTNYRKTRILTLVQHAAVIKYATDQATNGGKAATRQMLYNAIVFLRAGDRKPLLTWRELQKWLKATAKLHKIKMKPIAS
jgi:hypothetical protein